MSVRHPDLAGRHCRKAVRHGVEPLFAFCFAVTLLAASFVQAQVAGISEPMTNLESVEDFGVEAEGVRDGAVVVAPIPFKNEAIGTGLALGGGYVFRFSENQSSSYVALGAFKTENGSLGGGASVFLSFPGDRFRLQALAGMANLKYEVRVGRRLTEVRQETPILRFGGEFRMTPKLYGGLRVTLLDVNLASSSQARRDDLIDLDLERSIRVTMPELTLSYEDVDDDIYPRSGLKGLLSLAQAQVDGTRTGEYSKAYLNINHYAPFGANDVLASEVTLCRGDSGLPFYLQCAIGGTDTLRGFSPTEFFSEELASLQTEYRGRLGDRWGYVAFAGVATLGDKSLPLPEDVFASAGLGLRYRVSKKFPVDFAIDVARTNLDTQSVSASVGQRF